MQNDRSTWFFWMIIFLPRIMAQLSPQKRKKRRVQLREAQRRRRARLKEDSKSFLQIILSQETLSALRSYSETIGKPLHTSAADLIDQGLRREQNVEQSYPEKTLSSEAPVEGSNGTHSEAFSPSKPHEDSGILPEATSGQMDLFRG
jgi:hypothetical protein